MLAHLKITLQNKFTQVPGTNMRYATTIIIHHPDHYNRDHHLGDVGDVDIVQHNSSSLAAAQPTLVLSWFLIISNAFRYSVKLLKLHPK